MAVSPRQAAAVARRAPPYLRVDWEVADASALQALERGDASADQQRRALRWILKNAAIVQQVTFQPESDRATAFAEGRRFVGLKIAELLGASTRDLLRNIAAQTKQGTHT